MPPGLSARSRFQKFLSVCVALLLGVSVVSVLGQGMARAAVVCPTVAPTVPHTVTPAPSAIVDWTGCDLTDADLSGANFFLATLTGANLTGADLTGANLTNATLTDANFTGADLSGATWYITTITGAILADANFGTGLRSDNVYGTPASLPPGWGIPANTLVGPYADISGSNLITAEFKNIDMTGVNVTGTNFSFVSFIGCKTFPLVGTPIGLSPGYNGMVGNYLIAPGVNLKNADLTGFDLSNFQLDGVSSGGVVGTPTLPTGYQMAGGYIVGDNAVLTGANLDGLALANAHLHGVITGGITGTPASLPEGVLLRGGYLIGPYIDLTNLDLTGFDLTGVNLSHSTIENTNFSGTTLSGVASGSMNGTPINVPSPWVVLRQYFLGPNANLHGADLQYLDFGIVDLTNADLTGAYLTASDLSQVTMDGVKGAGQASPVAPNVLPPQWLYFIYCPSSPAFCTPPGVLVGPNANIVGADLANLDLTTATLTNVRSGSVTGTNYLLPTGWGLRNGFLVGPTANLVEADLTNQNLVGLDLSNADFDNADLTGAVLTGVNVTGATFAGVTWSNTTCVDGYNSNMHPQGSCLNPLGTAPPTTTGTYKVGYKITCNAVATNANGAPQFAWLNNGVVIAGQSASTYTLPGSMYNHSISCRVTLSKTYPSPDPISSSAHLVGLGNKPALKTAPVITKTVKVGTRIYASKGTWSLSGLSYSYQWKRSGKAIAGSAARSSSWKVVAADKGKYLTCTVTVKKSGYASNSATTGRKKAA